MLAYGRGPIKKSFLQDLITSSVATGRPLSMKPLSGFSNLVTVLLAGDAKLLLEVSASAGTAQQIRRLVFSKTRSSSGTAVNCSTTRVSRSFVNTWRNLYCEKGSVAGADLDDEGADKSVCLVGKLDPLVVVDRVSVNVSFGPVEVGGLGRGLVQLALRQGLTVHVELEQDETPS